MNLYADKPRSRLMRLKPVTLAQGLGESLISYISRLAVAHGFTVSTLLNYLLNPGSESPKSSNTQFWNYGYSSLNGYRGKADRYVQALESLNHGTDLSLLTMLPWKGLLDSRGKGLFAKKRRWCPQCYSDSAQQESGVFEPLCWSIAIMESCPVHECKLLSNCHSCGAIQHMIPRQVSMGHCFHCGIFLGRGKVSEPRALTQKEKYLLNLLDGSRAAVGEEDLEVNLVRGLNRVMSGLGVSSYKKLESEIGFSRETICQWVADKQSSRKTRPTLSSLINFCFAVSVPPQTLLFEPENIRPQIVDIKFAGRHQFPNSSKKEWVRQQLNLKLKTLQSALPLKVLAGQLEVGVGYLRYHFPVEVEKLLSKNKHCRSEEQAQKRANVHINKSWSERRW